jgi:vacuolar-type H+-ATPase subunit I/STV1
MMSFSTIILGILVMTVVGLAPTWPANRSWGHAHNGAVWPVMAVLMVVLLLGCM